MMQPRHIRRLLLHRIPVVRQQRQQARHALLQSSLRWLTTLPVNDGSNSKTSNNNNNNRYDRFDPTKTLSEWTTLTEELLHHSPVPETTIEAIRFWTTQRTPQAVDFAFLLFDKLLDDIENEELPTEHWMTGNFPQSTHVLNAILDSWRVCWQQQQQQQDEQDTSSTAPEKKNTTTRKSPLPTPYQVRDRIEAWADQNSLLLDARSYSLILQTTPNDAGFCHDVLETLLTGGGGHHPTPDIVLLTLVLKSLPEPDRALEFFHHMLVLYDEGNSLDETAQPNTVFYNTLLHKLVVAVVPSSSSSSQGDRRHGRQMSQAQDIFDSMKLSPYPQVTPNAVSYRLMVGGWANAAADLWKERRHDNASQQARAAVRQGLELVQQGLRQQQEHEHNDDNHHNNGHDGNHNEESLIDSSLYSKLLTTVVRYGSTDQDYALAQEIFDAVQTAALAPDVQMIRAMVLLYAKRGRPQQAERLLQGLHEMGLAKRGHYRDVISAFVRADQPAEAAQWLEVLLTKKEAYFCPDAWLIDQVLQATSRSADLEASYTEGLVRHIHTIYQETGFSELAPIPNHWVRMLSAWSHSRSSKPEATQRRVLDLVDELERLPNVDRSHWMAAVKALQRVQAPLERTLRIWQLTATSKKIQPDAVLCNAVLQTCLKANAAQDSHDVLSRWLDLAQLGRRRGGIHPPTPAQCDKVLKLLSRTPTAKASQTQALMERLPTVTPFHYMRVWKAWSHSREPEAAQRIQDSIQRMEDQFADSKSTKHLNQTHYTAAVVALSRAKAPIQDIVRLWQRAREQPGVCPDVWFYNAILKACADYSAGALALEVWACLARDQREVQPTSDLLNLVLLAISRSPGSHHQAHTFFEQARKKVRPNHRTYKLLMDCLSQEDDRQVDLLELYRREQHRLKVREVNMHS